MKICFIGGARYGEPLDAVAEKKFRLLGDLGEIHVIGFARSLRPVSFRGCARFYLLPLLPLPVLRHAAMTFLGAALVAWLVATGGVRVVIAQSPYEAFGAAMVKRAARFCGVRLVLVVESHGGFATHLFVHRRVWFPQLTRAVMRGVARYSLVHADILRSISQWTRQEMEALVSGKPMVQFPAWSDMEPFLEAGRRARPEPAGMTILYAGALISGKGVHDLVHAFGLIQDAFGSARLEIVGPALDAGYAGQLRELCAALGMTRRVEFLGPLAPRELARRMADAAVFVLPSHSEGLGRVVFEAMAAGAPVVASRTGGIPDMIEDGVTGLLFTPGDAAELASQLRRILDDPELAAALARRGREFAHQFFSPEKYRAGYAAIFETAHALAAAQSGNGRF